MNLGGEKIQSKTNLSPVNLSPSKMPTITVNNKISTNKFLEFLKIACHVNDSIMYGDNNHNEINYDQLKNNEIINNLMEKSNKDINTSNSNSSIGIHTSNHQEVNVKKLIPNLSKTYQPLNLAVTSSSTSTLVSQTHDVKHEIFKKNHPFISEKLDEVFSEGILDSVISYICPTHSLSLINSKHDINETNNNNNINGNNCCNNNEKITRKPIGALESLNTKSLKQMIPSSCDITYAGSTAAVNENVSSKTARKRSLSTLHNNNSVERPNESEVVIRVCDEIKDTSKDFYCPQNLLVSKMGYFADVTAGQNLEDMDISVHCDIQIFDWLMRWVKRDSKYKSENIPELDASNVIPILVSACFLQMEPLLLDCLSFCHSRLNDIVRSSANLSCLNDCIITRLAAMFTNLELEMISDKKERVTPKLWMKLITSLCEPEPQALRGHYFTLSGIYRCSKCEKYVTHTASSYVSCNSSNMRLNRWGQLVSEHVRDTTWDLSKYVLNLFKEMKSWRKVYWKLWGHCHYLYCCMCETYFPAYQMTWCRYHSEAPQYFGPISDGLAPGPAGRYSCCGQLAFRFETLPGPNGCKFREHSVLIETDRDRAILTLAQIVSEKGCLYDAPTKKIIMEATQKDKNFESSWTGLQLMPTKCRQGLLPQINIDDNNSKLMRRNRQSAYVSDSSSSSETTSDTSVERTRKTLNRENSKTSSDGCESETFNRKKFRARRRRRAYTSGRFWCCESSARSNQDNQREYEERIMKQVINMVRKKSDESNTIKKKIKPNGGTYIQLEAEWKDNVKHKVLLKPRQK